MPEIKSCQDLMGLFEFGSKYDEPICLKDENIGFSVKRKYDDDILYKPVVKKDNEPDELCMIHVVYGKPRGKDESDKPVPISCHVSKFSKYLSRHSDYEYSDNESPSKESVELSRSSVQYAPKDYFDIIVYLSPENGRFITSENGDTVTGKELLEKIYEIHVRRSRKYGGLGIRMKPKLIMKIDLLLQGIEVFIINFILKKIFGRYIQGDPRFYLRQKLEKSDLKKLRVDSISFLNIKVSHNSLICFCLLVAVSFVAFYRYQWRPRYVVIVLKNDFLVTIFSILVLYFMDEIVPQFIRRFILNPILWLNRKLLGLPN